jgi:hypothetical protein
VISTVRYVPAARARGLQRYLMERELGSDICTWVRARRGEGKTWDAIAEEMSAALRLPPKDKVTQVTRQLLQKWCAES